MSATTERDRRPAPIEPDAKGLDLLSRLPAGAVQRTIVRGATRVR